MKANNHPDPVPYEELTILAFPLRTFEYLSREADKRGLTLTQLICRAVDQFIGETVMTKED